jgi:hypothetical protein
VKELRLAIDQVASHQGKTMVSLSGASKENGKSSTKDPRAKGVKGTKPISACKNRNCLAKVVAKWSASAAEFVVTEVVPHGQCIGSGTPKTSLIMSSHDVVGMIASGTVRADSIRSAIATSFSAGVKKHQVPRAKRAAQQLADSVQVVFLLYFTETLE